jgi:hypothetical protein
VDRHLAPVAHKVGTPAVDRLVTEAIGRFMPEIAEATRRQAADGRHLEVDHHQISFAGTSLIHGELDLADALDLDAALAHRAAELKDFGCAESLDVRRSMAIGELARHQLALDLPAPDTPVVEEGALAPVAKPPADLVASRRSQSSLPNHRVAQGQFAGCAPWVSTRARLAVLIGHVGRGRVTTRSE